MIVLNSTMMMSNTAKNEIGSKSGSAASGSLKAMAANVVGDMIMSDSMAEISMVNLLA